MTLKAQATPHSPTPKKKKDKLDLVKILKFYASKDTVIDNKNYVSAHS